MDKKNLELSVAELSEANSQSLLANGFEDAYIGYAWQFNNEPLAVYDIGRCVQILVERDGMDLEEAQEYIDFNLAGAWMGEGTPMLIKTEFEPYEGEEDGE